MIDPTFSQTKHVRGFRQFLLRGLDKMRGEWRLICMTYAVPSLWDTRDGVGRFQRTVRSAPKRYCRPGELNAPGS